jgi:hypothetical protein
MRMASSDELVGGLFANQTATDMGPKFIADPIAVPLAAAAAASASAASASALKRRALIWLETSPALW